MGDGGLQVCLFHGVLGGWVCFVCDYWEGMKYRIGVFGTRLRGLGVALWGLP